MIDIAEFELFDHLPHEIPSVYERIRAGDVPVETLFRLAAIGFAEIDPGSERQSLRWRILQDIGDNGSDMDSLRQDTYEILYGDLPDLVIDFWHRKNRHFYPSLDTMYYTIDDMARAIRENREERGVRVYNPLIGDHFSDEEKLRRTCFGDARKIWRLLVQRIRPEVITSPDRFCPPTLSFGVVYYASERSMARRAVASAVISDEAIYKIFEESKVTGVKGIAREGQSILRRLLAEEHPELYQQFL